MSLLQASGHPDAAFYHIGRVFDEAALVVDQRNRDMATLGIVVQSATMTTGMGATQKSLDHFNKLINGLNGEA